MSGLPQAQQSGMVWRGAPAFGMFACAVVDIVEVDSEMCFCYMWFFEIGFEWLVSKDLETVLFG